MDVVRTLGVSNDRIHSLHCQVTTDCNFLCPGCFYQNKGHARHTHWTWELAERVLDDAAMMGVQWIAIGGGEPTTWRHLLRFCVEAARRQLKIALTTNGTRLETAMVDRVHISHDTMHRKGSGLKKHDREREVLKAIEYYKDYAPSGVGINCRADQINTVSNKVLEAVDTVTLVLPKPVLKVEDLVDYWPDRLRKAIKRCSKSQAQVSVDGCMMNLLNMRQCGQGRISMYIDVNGEGYACSNIAASCPRPKPSGMISLSAKWEMIRCRNYKCPAGCLVPNESADS